MKLEDYRFLVLVVIYWNILDYSFFKYKMRGLDCVFSVFYNLWYFMGKIL